jgi:hypothetical protein
MTFDDLPEDTLMLQTRTFPVEQICRCFSVPPAPAGYSGQTTWGAGGLSHFQPSNDARYPGGPQNHGAKHMVDEAKTITSDTLGHRPDQTVNVGGAENKRDDSGDQTVSVKALKTFHKDGNMRGDVVGPDSPAFDVDRQRAAQLRANGLIEYANESDDHAIHGEVDAKRIGEKVKQQAEASKIPANSRGTPLRNPEVKLADVKDAK